MLAIQEDLNGDLWIGTRVDGVLRLDRSSGTFTPVLPGAETGAVWDLLLDRNGGLWIGTEKRGLYRRDPASVLWPRQPALRELLWESDLRLAILPEEYNLMVVSRLASWWTWSPQPSPQQKNPRK